MEDQEGIARKLTEADLDAALAWKSQQGRYGDWPMPEEEFPSLSSPLVRFFAALIVVGTIAVCFAIDWKAVMS